MELAKAIKELYPDAVPGKDFQLRDDGEGPYIWLWNLPDVKPSDSSLAAAIITADQKETSAKETRRTQKAALLAKLKLNENEVALLKEILR